MMIRLFGERTLQVFESLTTKEVKGHACFKDSRFGEDIISVFASAKKLLEGCEVTWLSPENGSDSVLMSVESKRKMFGLLDSDWTRDLAFFISLKFV